MSLPYQSIQNPMIYGIMYAETLGNTAETTWYYTQEDRDYAIESILTTGQLFLYYPDSPIGQTVNVYAFASIEAESSFYKQIGEYE